MQSQAMYEGRCETVESLNEGYGFLSARRISCGQDVYE